MRKRSVIAFLFTAIKSHAICEAYSAITVSEGQNEY